MPKGADWQNLEEKLKTMLQSDNARTIPGSGNSKGEEDVVGFSTITQCKFSENKNVTLLSKDIERLKEAAILQEKTPLFASENNKELILSLLDGEFLPLVIDLLVSLSQLNKLEKDLDICKNINTWEDINKKFENETKKTADKVIRTLIDKKKEINTKLEVIYADLTQLDLFK